MSKPILYVFAISHYCEKARWALEHHGIDHRIAHAPPGPHLRLAKKLGAPQSSLPILVAEAGTIQGSAMIIDWADATTSSASKRLTPPGGGEDCLQIERRFDDVLGVHIRRWYYSEAMVNHPETVRPIFARHLPFGRSSCSEASGAGFAKR